MRVTKCALPCVTSSSLRPRPGSAQHMSARPSRRQRTQESNCRNVARFAPFAISSLRTLFRAPELQQLLFQALPDSFAAIENITTAFSATSALFVRSFACHKVLTRLFSSARALFCKNTREGGYTLCQRDFERFFGFERESQMRVPARRAVVAWLSGARAVSRVFERKSPARGAFAVARSSCNQISGKAN